MNRTALIALTLLLGASCAAQVRFGERLGFSKYRQETGQLPGTGEGFYGTLTYKAASFIGTVFVDVPVTKHFLVGAEIGYSERGYKREGDPPIFPNVEVLKSSYAGLTILPKLLIGKSNVKLELCVGFDAAWRFNLRDQYPRTSVYVTDSTALLNPDRGALMAKQDLSLVAGVGLVLGGGPVKFHVSTRYVHGVSNVYLHNVSFLDRNGSTVGIGPMYNRSFGATVGFSVPLSRSGWEKRSVE